MEFFIAIVIAFSPTQPTPYFEAVPFRDESTCKQAVNSAEELLKERFPDADVRISCVSSESIGQNSV